MTEVWPATRYDCVLDTPVGRLGIRVQGERLSGMDFLEDAIPLQPAATRVAWQVAEQLADYFCDPRSRFKLPLLMGGTPFQQRVWQALLEIPSGETRSYGELAARLDSGARAVGNACRRNPIPVIVPCHRVVSATGIGGYGGRTAGRVLRRKQWLLEHESMPATALEKSTRRPHRGTRPRKHRGIDSHDR